MRVLSAAFLLVAFGVAHNAWAALRINEVLTNIPGGGDNGFEFVEISGTASESVNGVWFIEIDSNGGTNGAIRSAIDLTAAGTVGTNGLLLVRDSATVLSPAPDAATTLFVNDFNPDLENDTTTFALVTVFTGSVGQDLDTNNDGTIDVTLPWTTTLDAVTIQDSGGGDFPHADDLGGAVLSVFGFTPDYIFRNPNSPATWIGSDVTGTNPGPYTIAITEVSDLDFAGLGTTPGSPNSSPVASVNALSVPTFKE
jgi:hypothetical protein